MFRLALIAVVLAAGCQKDAPDGKQSRTTGARTTGTGGDDEVLARVGDVEITVGEFEDQINRQAPYIRARYTSLEQKREFLDSMLRFEILAAEAQRRGLDKDAEVVRTMKSVMVQKLLREQLDPSVPADAVTDAEVRAYYDAHPAEYARDEQVRASAIIVKDRATAAKIAAEAHGEAGRTNKGFRDLVEKYSTDERTRLRGGDLRYFGKVGEGEDQPPAPVVAAGFALPQVGAVSDAIDAGDGTFYILKETGHRRPMVKSFGEVESTIRSKLHRDKRLDAQDDFVDGLKKTAKIEIVEDNLAKVRIETAKQPEAEPHD